MFYYIELTLIKDLKVFYQNKKDYLLEVVFCRDAIYCVLANYIIRLFPAFSLLGIYYSEGSEIDHFIHTSIHQGDMYRLGKT